jgi:hypothetical protein
MLLMLIEGCYLAPGKEKTFFDQYTSRWNVINTRIVNLPCNLLYGSNIESIVQGVYSSLNI